MKKYWICSTIETPYGGMWGRGASKAEARIECLKNYGPRRKYWPKHVAKVLFHEVTWDPSVVPAGEDELPLIDKYGGIVYYGSYETTEKTPGQDMLDRMMET